MKISLTKLNFLKSYWKPETETLSIEQGLSSLDFGFEFQEPVIQSLSESRQVTYAFMTALADQRAICLSGDIGSGKTTLIQSLASRLGKLCNFIIMSKSLDSEFIVKNFRSICEADCWGVFEEIDNLTPDTLSLLSTPLQTIEIAKDLRLQQFTLNGVETNLGSNSSILFHQ